MKKTGFVTALVAIVAVGLAARFVLANDAAVGYRTVSVERGDVEEVVTSTGTLQATETVEVGTQVSGQIASLLVDFNDRVVTGQLLARIDSTLLAAEVRAVEASLRRAQAELDQADRTLARSQALHDSLILTDSEFEQAAYGQSVAAASRDAAVVNVERARRNLAYTEIRAPIDGVVVERTVDSGQTVAASMSAPKLFVIARDLSAMEILASVDESDIGRIQEGQEVRFTVQAYSNRSFSGTVQQVRLQSATVDNVVSYGVVVSVGNPDGILLPGMTATVEFVVHRETDVLKVANTALRFRPSGTAATASGETAPRSARPAGTAGDGASGMLWTLDASGQPRPLQVAAGLSDGQQTAVTGTALEEGTVAIVAEVSGSTDTGSATSNPFQTTSQSGPPRPGGF